MSELAGFTEAVHCSFLHQIDSHFQAYYHQSKYDMSVWHLCPGEWQFFPSRLKFIYVVNWKCTLNIDAYYGCKTLLQNTDMLSSMYRPHISPLYDIIASQCHILTLTLVNTSKLAINPLIAILIRLVWSPNISSTASQWSRVIQRNKLRVTHAQHHNGLTTIINVYQI